MKTSIKLLAPFVVSTLFCASAHAAVISFGGVNATDGSGLISNLVPNVNDLVTSNVLDPNNANFGLFLETFDNATRMNVFDVNGAPANTSFNVETTADCALNSSAGGIDITTSSSSAFAITTGSRSGAYAAPANDNTCFGFTPAPGGTLPSWVAIDYSNLLASFGNLFGGTWRIDYLGFYWGSVDRYNDFMFYNTSITDVQGFNPLTSQGESNPYNTMLSGNNLLNELGGPAGNQQSDKSNVYVNIDFAKDETFTSVAIRSTGVAGEFDNIVVRVSQVDVPSPSTLGLFGLSLLGLGLLGRRKQALK